MTDMKLEIHYDSGGSWAALYVNGTLDRVGDAYVPVRSGLGDPKLAGPVLSAERAQRLREDLDVLAAERGRAATELRGGGNSGE